MSTTHDASRHEVEELQAQLDHARIIIEALRAGLAVVASQAGEVRCQTAELRDTSHSCDPFHPDALNRSTARLATRGDTLSRMAHGYTALGEKDMVYRGLLPDLEAHGWHLLPERTLDGTLPPGPWSEIQERQHAVGSKSHGHLRGWTRKAFGESIYLWFTSPFTFAFAWSSLIGRLHTANEIGVIVCSTPGDIKGPGELPRRCNWPNDVMFDASCGQVSTCLEGHGWKRDVEFPCDQHGRERTNGQWRGTAWRHPQHAERRIFVWQSLLLRTVRAGYWSGPLRCLAQLDEVAGRK